MTHLRIVFGRLPFATARRATAANEGTLRQALTGGLKAQPSTDAGLHERIGQGASQLVGGSPAGAVTRHHHTPSRGP